MADLVDVKLIDGTARTVRELFTGRKYSLDYYQREYTWTESNVIEMLDDLATSFLADALPKLKGLARFAERYGDRFLRIDAVAELGKEMRVLDMKDEKVRLVVEAATGSDAEPLYRSEVSAEYR